MSRSRNVRMAYDLFVPIKEEEDVPLFPVILLHGMTFSRKTWLKMPQIIADATKRKVYALDARNHGESDWSDEFDFQAMARDVEVFMDEVHILKAVLVGHSMGGKTAMHLALTKPGRVEKLIVEDILPERILPTDNKSPCGYLKLMRRSLSHVSSRCDLERAREIVARYLECQAPELLRRWRTPVNRDTTLLLKMTDNGATWQANIDVIEYSISNNPQYHKRFEGIYEGEVLFLYGTKSYHDVNNGKDEILKLFPKAVLSAVEGAAHLVHLEFPGEFCTKVVNFIGRI